MLHTGQTPVGSLHSKYNFMTFSITATSKKTFIHYTIVIKTDNHWNSFIHIKDTFFSVRIKYIYLKIISSDKAATCILVSNKLFVLILDVKPIIIAVL